MKWCRHTDRQANQGYIGCIEDSLGLIQGLFVDSLGYTGSIKYCSRLQKTDLFLPGFLLGMRSHANRCGRGFQLKWAVFTINVCSTMFYRPGVAGAVLQSPRSLVN